MKKIKISALVAIVALLTSCSPVKVITEVNKDIDFSSYETYSFLGWQDNSNEILSEFDQKRIRDAFISEFEARGLKPVAENGDMVVSLFIVVDQKTSTTAYTDYYGRGAYGRYNRYGAGWGNGYATTTYHESDYLMGTLVMDVFDGAKSDQVWQGIAKGTVTENPEKRDKSIPKSIAALMKEFPIAPEE